MPLVLVHNDVVRNPAHEWDDVEGVRYHYPAKYQAKISTGEPFVYYRGVLRADGSRGLPNTSARAASVRLPDPERSDGVRKAWYCAIEDYVRFAKPMAAKLGGETLEQIPRNMWRDGIRPLDPVVYQRIMSLAAAQPSLAATASPRAGHDTGER